MYKLYILLLLTLYSYPATVKAQTVEKIGEYTFIQYDSIPMIFVDTVTLWGYEVATATLNVKKDLYYYAALTPAYPLWKTRIEGFNLPYEERIKLQCFYTIRDICVNYRTVVDGDTVLIDTHEKFRKVFAPVDNIQEAIAFAYIFIDARPIYNLDFLKPEALREEKENWDQPRKVISAADIKDGEDIPLIEPIIFPPFVGWKIDLPTISSSYAKIVDDGYELLLYRKTPLNAFYDECLIKVYFNGTVEVLKQQSAFYDRENYDFPWIE